MMRRRLSLVVIVMLGLSIDGGHDADAAVYAANRCVAAKQVRAAKYCRAALNAWARWEATRDDVKRDTILQRAADILSDSWVQADANAFDVDTDCAETTLTRAAAQSLIDTAIAGIVTAINTGLDLGDARDARCGSKLLRAAATKCNALLRAESRYIRRLDKDPTGATRHASRQKASDAFSQAWAKQSRRECPTDAEEPDIESRVDGIGADIVLNTIVSPNVDDTQFTTYSPTGTTRYLGKDLQPVCMNGSPYHFFAKRGTVNKLLVYYQGGGACWEQLTCSVPVCDTNVNPTGSDNPNNVSVGLADRTNPANPFRDWNIVFVPYCSCDVHFGDAAQDYPLHVEHRGYHNARVVEKWAREHFVNPEVVFVTGSSAGAYGAWFHAPLLHQVWPASQFHVLADAGNGVITQEFLETYFPNWNFVGNIPRDIPGVLEVIEAGTGIPGYTKVVANLFPNTNWAHYSTAYDGGVGGQSSFYNLMLNGNDPIQGVFWYEASCAFNEAMRNQAIATAATLPSNYRYYIGTGTRHTMFGSSKVYTDTTGGVPTIVDWINAMLDTSPAWTNVECAPCGLTLAGDPVPNPLEPPFEMVGSDVVVNCP